MTQAPAIEACSLTKVFDRGRLVTRIAGRGPRRRPIIALDDVSFTVGFGELVALCGANGSGKSTLLRVLSTLVTPTSGEAAIAGHDIVTEAIPVRHRLAFVPSDDRSFSLRLTGRESLHLHAALHCVPKSRRAEAIDRALDRVNLLVEADEPYGGYSSGMRQRLAIARALVTGADVLLLDEPFRALDEQHTAALAGLLTGLAAVDGRAVLAVTHQLDPLAGSWTKVLRLDSGRLAEEPKPAPEDAAMEAR